MNSIAIPNASKGVDWKAENDQLNLLLQTSSPDSVRERALELVQQAPHSPHPYRWLTDIALLANDIPAARAALGEGQKRGAEGVIWQRLEIRIAIAEGNDRLAIDLALSFASKGRFPAGPRDRRELVRAANRLGDWAVLEEICDAALDQVPDDPAWIEEKYKAFTSGLAGRADIDALKDRIFGATGGPAHLAGLTFYVKTVDATDPKIAELVQQARNTWPDAPETQALQRDIDLLLEYRNPAVVVCNAAPLETPDLPPEAKSLMMIEGIASKPLQVSPDRPSNTILLAFLPSHVAVALFDRYAAALGITAIYPQDPGGCFATGGLSVFGPGYAASVAGIRQLLQDLKPGGELTILGLSGGCIGAINFAADLPTERLLLFGPVTCVDPEFQTRIGDTRRPATLKKMTDRIPAENRFPVERLGNSPPKQTVVVYSENNPVDTAHAELMNGIPDVRFEILKKTDAHHTARYMMRKEGKLFDFLRQTLETRTS